MDFEEIWSEHKQFILMVGIGVIALLVFQGVKTALFTDDTGRSVTAATRNQRLLRGEAVAKRTDIRALEEEETTLTARLERLAKEMTLTVPEAYQLPASNVKSFFIRVVQETRDKVAEIAGIRNIRIPYELGVPSVTPNTRDEMARYLAGLYVVERVVTYAVEEQVRRFESIEVKPGKGAGFLSETRVVFRISSDGPALAALVDRILDPADRLNLVQFDVFHPARGGGLVATLGIAIPQISVDKPISEEGVG